MTVWVNMVIKFIHRTARMPSWTLEQLEQAMASMVEPGDPADPRAQKRARLLRAATQLFVRHGYRKTSIDEVARRAGLAKGTVYLYFRNKAELLTHAVVAEKHRYLERVRPLLAEPLPGRERLRRYLRATLVIAAEMPLVSRLMAGDDELHAVMADLAPEERARMNEMRVSFLAAMLDAAAAPHDLSAEQLTERASVLAGVLHHAPLFDEEMRGGLSLERYADVLAHMIVDGICADPPKDRGADHG